MFFKIVQFVRIFNLKIIIEKGFVHMSSLTFFCLVLYVANAIERITKSGAL